MDGRRVHWVRTWGGGGGGRCFRSLFAACVVELDPGTVRASLGFPCTTESPLYKTGAGGSADRYSLIFYNTSSARVPTPIIPAGVDTAYCERL